MVVLTYGTYWQVSSRSRNRRNESLRLLSFEEFADLDDPLPPPESSSGVASTGGNEPSPEQISMIVDMGFTAQQGKKALLETVCFLFSFPSSSPSLFIS